MAGNLLHRIFGQRTSGRAEVDAEIETLVIDLAVRMPKDAWAELAPVREAVLASRQNAKLRALASLFSAAEDRLAAMAADARTYRSQFRAQIARHWPAVAASDEMALVLAPPDEQELTLCRFFLRTVIKDACSLLGMAGVQKLVGLQHWLEGDLHRSDPPSFPPIARAESSEGAIVAVQGYSQQVYDWLHEVIGRRTTAIYDMAYQRSAAQFGAIDGFPVVLGMLPERLVSADKISLLQRSQIEQVLRQKVDQLERLNVELRDTRDSLEERVRERTRDLETANQTLARNLAELNEAKRQADAASRSKSEFLANISHELRTPLNAILGFAQFLTEPTLRHLARERFTEYAENICKSGAHLLDVINEILDFSKVESGRWDLVEENVPVPELIETCLTMMSGQLAGTGLNIEREVESGLPEVLVDRRMMTQMVLNLLSNAIKFTKPGGRIRVEAKSCQTGEVELVVHDTGIGIAEHDLALVLEPFRQVRGAYQRDHSGTGLGLPLVLGMARLHGGDLSLRSTLGAGTSAVIRLPRRRVLWPPQGHGVNAGT